MPLTELMNYFNDQLQTQARSKKLPSTGFYKADNTYWARFGNLILGSQFHTLQYCNREGELGYEAELSVRASTGNLLDIDSIFNSLDNQDQIVHLDRLVRTLHSLNYLQRNYVQKYEGEVKTLSLEVQPRHIVSVADNHGKTFEAILSDCGLRPEKVLLHTRLLDEQSLLHFYKALSNYRLRGYQIGVWLKRESNLNLLANLGLVVDALFFEDALFKSIAPVQQNLLSLQPRELHEAKRILVTQNAEVNANLIQFFDAVLVKPPNTEVVANLLQQVSSY